MFAEISVVYGSTYESCDTVRRWKKNVSGLESIENALKSDMAKSTSCDEIVSK